MEEDRVVQIKYAWLKKIPATDFITDFKIATYNAIFLNGSCRDKACAVL